MTWLSLWLCCDKHHSNSVKSPHNYKCTINPAACTLVQQHDTNTHHYFQLTKWDCRANTHLLYLCSGRRYESGAADGGVLAAPCSEVMMNWTGWPGMSEAGARDALETPCRGDGGIGFDQGRRRGGGGGGGYTSFLQLLHLLLLNLLNAWLFRFRFFFFFFDLNCFALRIYLFLHDRTLYLSI